MPALQRKDQVCGSARPGRGSGIRRRGDRAPRPARRGRASASKRRPGQGPVVRARRVDPGSARPIDLSARRLDQDAGPGRGRGAWPRRRRQADSHDICFIADGDTQAFLDRRLGEDAGQHRRRCDRRHPGHHVGSHGYTIGQRKGLRLDRPAPTDARVTCFRSSRSPTRSRSARSRRSTSTWLPPSGRVWTGMGHAGRWRSRRRCRCVRRARPRPHGSRLAPDGTLVCHVGFAGTRNCSGPGHRGVSPGRERRHRARIGHDRASGPPGHGRVVSDPLPWPPGSSHRSGFPPRPSTSAEAVKTVLGEVPDLPYLPELPARGPGADMIGRSAGLLIDIPVELYAAQWRIASHAGRDLRRTRDLWDRDLDALTDAAAGLDGNPQAAWSPARGR